MEALSRAIIAGTAIAAITVIEVCAVLQGIDGYALAASFAGIGGVSGYYWKSVSKRG